MTLKEAQDYLASMYKSMPSLDKLKEQDDAHWQNTAINMATTDPLMLIKSVKTLFKLMAALAIIEHHRRLKNN